MFSCVWLHFHKFFEKYFLVFGKEEGKDKSRKTRTKPRLTLDAWLGSTARCFASSSLTTTSSIRSREAPRRFARSRSTWRRDHDRRRDLAKWSARRWDRDCRREGEIAINGVRSRSQITIDGAGACERSGLELGECVLLSLSLSLRNSFEVKIGTKIHFRSQSLFFWVNGNQFSENSIFWTNQIPAFLEKHFKKWFSPKTNTALEEWYCSPTFKKMTFFPLKFWRKSI